MKKLNLSRLYLYTELITPTTEEYTVYLPDNNVVGRFKLDSHTKKVLSMVGYCANLDEVKDYFSQPTGVET